MTRISYAVRRSQPLAPSHLRWLTALRLVAVFAPGFVTGSLVERCGTRAVAACGVALFILGAAVLMAGQTPTYFTVGMSLCGMAWNFSFSAGTIQLTLQTPPHEATAVQGANDFVVFLAAGIGAYPLSGCLFEACGWHGVVVASTALVCGLMPVLAVDAWRTKVAAQGRTCNAEVSSR